MSIIKRKGLSELKGRKASVISGLIDHVYSGTSLLYLLGNDEKNTLLDVRRAISSLIKYQKKEGEPREYSYYEWSSAKGLYEFQMSPINKQFDAEFNNYITAEKEDEVLQQTSTQVNMTMPSPQGGGMIPLNQTDPLSPLTFLTSKSVQTRKDASASSVKLKIVVMKDVHPFLEKNPNFVRKVKDIIIDNDSDLEDALNRRLIIIFVGNTKVVPAEIENLITVIDWGQPTPDEIVDHLKGLVIEEIVDKVPTEKDIFRTKYTKEEVDQIKSALTGLSYPEIETAITTSNVRFGELKPEFLVDFKRQIALKNGMLEYRPVNNAMADVGGLDCLKDWIKVRKTAYSKEAQEFGIKPPKGVLLVGIQGCGKSLSAQAIAAEFGLPLVVFDIGRVLSKTVGSSEENMRRTLATLDAISPVVAVFEEAEKALSGVRSSESSDAGTTSRVVSTLLDWMQNRTSPVFVVMTANDIRKFDAEQIRKGRLDEVFFCSLPEEDEREEIFRIHLKKAGRNPNDFDVKAFAKMSANFSGSEIEYVIHDALIIAFNSPKRKLDNMHILQAIKQAIPLFRTCEEQLQFMYDWVGWDEERKEGNRARYASQSRKRQSEKEGKNIIKLRDMSKKEAS
jgi:SpoVK/Ycf46/Vps4 family AAA+-type ATPase